MVGGCQNSEAARLNDISLDVNASGMLQPYKASRNHGHVSVVLNQIMQDHSALPFN